jgi:hypothetical protein
MYPRFFKFKFRMRALASLFTWLEDMLKTDRARSFPVSLGGCELTALAQLLLLEIVDEARRKLI